MKELKEKENFSKKAILEKKDEFLSKTDWKDAKVIPLAQDVSVRTFFRVEKDASTAILMEARPPLEDVSMFEFMRNKFSKLGFSVPEIYNIDIENGFVLMEDFGDKRCYEYVTEKTEDPEKIYSLGVDVLAHKFAADPKVALEGSVFYTDEYWLFRVEQFLLHYMPKILNREPTEEQRDEFLSLFKEAIEQSHALDDVLLHGDFGVQNLYYFPDKTGIEAMGIIDFQDMTDARGNMRGSPAFDLVMFLQDVRVDVLEGLENSMIERFLEKTVIKDTDAFMREYRIIGTAQAVKCLGLFARLGHGDGREEYLKFIPHCLRNLRRNLSHPVLKGIEAWFAKNKIEY